MNEQADNQRRVAAKISGHILDFLRSRLAMPPAAFYMSELLEYVSTRVSIAPDSPGRILRQLRKSGVVDYVVVSRRDSLYEVRHVRTDTIVTISVDESAGGTRYIDDV